MTTARRTLLGALALAPILSAPAFANAPARADLSGYDLNALLDHAARTDPDAHFAALCAAMLEECERSSAADRLFDDAHNAAEAEAPFPAALKFRTGSVIDGERVEWDARWHPELGEWKFQTLAIRHMHATGLMFAAAESDLRAQLDSWQARSSAAGERYMVRELASAADAAGERLAEARSAVMGYRARNGETLLTQLYLRGAIEHYPDDAETWREIVASVARIVA